MLKMTAEKLVRVIKKVEEFSQLEISTKVNKIELRLRLSSNFNANTTSFNALNLWSDNRGKGSIDYATSKKIQLFCLNSIYVGLCSSIYEIPDVNSNQRKSAENHKKIKCAISINLIYSLKSAKFIQWFELRLMIISIFFCCRHRA